MEWMGSCMKKEGDRVWRKRGMVYEERGRKEREEEGKRGFHTLGPDGDGNDKANKMSSCKCFLQRARAFRYLETEALF
jgi:hypothetical protein